MAPALALGWLLIAMPMFVLTYGVLHPLQLCHVGALMTAAGILMSRASWVRAAALLSPMVAVFWIADLVWLSVSGTPLHGGTAYLFDAGTPLAVRVLSLFHLVLPVLHALWIRRHGYSGTALPIAMAVSLVILITSALLPGNLNLAHSWTGTVCHDVGAFGHGFIHWLVFTGVALIPAHGFWIWFGRARNRSTP